MIFFSVILCSHIVRFENNVLCEERKQYWGIGQNKRKPLVTLPALTSLSGQRSPQPAGGSCTLPDVLKALATRTAWYSLNQGHSVLRLGIFFFLISVSRMSLQISAWKCTSLSRPIIYVCCCGTCRCLCLVCFAISKRIVITFYYQACSSKALKILATAHLHNKHEIWLIGQVEPKALLSDLPIGFHYVFSLPVQILKPMLKMVLGTQRPRKKATGIPFE